MKVAAVLFTLAASALEFRAQVRKPQNPPAVPAFTDVAAAAGITFRHQASHTSQKYMIEPMGSGVAFLDFDQDGLLDIYFVNGGKIDDPMAPGALPSKSDPRYWNRLYRNTGSGRFEDVTERAGVRGHGYDMGVAIGDYDNDGYPDLYVTSFGRNVLYHNRNDGTFEDATDRAGVAADGWSSGAAFFDYDRDGLLDLVVSRYIEWDFQHNPWCGPEKQKMRGYCHPNVFQSVTHKLYRNKGAGTFIDVSESAGIAQHPGKGLGVAVQDFDRDGWPDILIANDSVAQQLFHNLRNGKFEEIGLRAGMAYNSNGASFAGMGAEFNDYNNDGWPDILVNALSLQSYALFRNMHGEFEDVSGETGLYRLTHNHAGWGMKLVDADNDGWRDIFVAQGHVMDTISVDYPQISYKQKLLLLRNHRGNFVDVSGSAGPAFQTALAARGAAFGDFDNDGRCDVALNTNDGPAILLRGGRNDNHWISVETIGTGSNRDGIGAAVRVMSTSGAEQFGYVSTASSYLSGNEKRVHFGLGADTRLLRLEVTWPSGTLQRLTGVAVDRVVKVKESAN